MNDLLLLLVGISAGIGVTFTIMQGRIEDAKAKSRAWARIAINLQDELGMKK